MATTGQEKTLHFPAALLYAGMTWEDTKAVWERKMEWNSNKRAGVRSGWKLREAQLLLSPL